MCPSPAEVQRQVDALVLDGGDGAGPPRSAILEETPGGLTVRLVEADGTLIFERVLPSGRSCGDLAEIAALVLASWSSKLTSQSSEAEPLPSLAAPAAPAPALAPRRAWSWEVALGPTVSFAGTFAPGGLLQVGTGPAQARWEVHAVGSYDGPRPQPEGTGQVSWQRAQLGLGGGYALSRLPYSLEVGGEVVLSDIFMAGQGFPNNGSTTSLDPGIDLGARLALLRGRWHPWVGVWATVWLREEYPTVTNAAFSPTPLPLVEGFAGVGLSWQSVERF